MAKDLAPIYWPVSVALGVAAVLALLLGLLAPPPWAQILALTTVLGAVWLFGILTGFAYTHPESTHPGRTPPTDAHPRPTRRRRRQRSRTHPRVGGSS